MARSPTLNVSSVVRHFKCGDAIKICSGIILDFYMGLQHTYFTRNFTVVKWAVSSHKCWSIRMVSLVIKVVMMIDSRGIKLNALAMCKLNQKWKNSDSVSGEVMPSSSWYCLQTTVASVA